MIAETIFVGIDVSRDWLDGFCLPGQQRVRHPNTEVGHTALVAMIRQMPGQVRVGFEGHEGSKTVRGTVFPNGGWAGMGALD